MTSECRPADEECRPPSGTECGSFHWLKQSDTESYLVREWWTGDEWEGGSTPKQMAAWGWRYYAIATPPSSDADRADAVGQTLRQAVDELRAVTRKHNVQFPSLEDIAQERAEDDEIRADAERFRWLMHQYETANEGAHLKIGIFVDIDSDDDIRAQIDADRGAGEDDHVNS